MGRSNNTLANWIARNARHEAFRQIRLRYLDEFQELYEAEKSRLRIVTGYEDGRGSDNHREAAARKAASQPRAETGTPIFRASSDTQ